ncbi:nuclear transport factor 2 family protein [Kaistia geumhonensis]|uniref:Ketosteroid isomerase-like protein n=1 Tax=Kaistia geumhonensis TaxID=410839 RepID=A0ABU0M6C9_9HYPH|nr:nuclear transport factor 2 family protein [Kaistia geumhonensis]MCX5478263.1 nuclear transport factor 2 family protein [Kaistia geumhonensis]MDQ0516520.1 ketosteroid isomerase-like protein [Kaistia geumhonensis]
MTGKDFNDEATLRAMLERQADAWKTGDFTLASDDWHPNGVLTAPGNRVPFDALAGTIRRFHDDFVDLEVTITNAFASPDGTKIAFEWLWTVSRRSDGARSATPDAIIVDLEDGKILEWREYFDTAAAVEDYHGKETGNEGTPGGDAAP